MVEVPPLSPEAMLSDSARPMDGDIVVREQQRGQRRVYLLRSQPGPDQIVVSSRATAFAQARSIALRVRVRAWLTVDGHAPLPLGDDARHAVQRAAGGAR
ncbi:hypothetical protein D3C83_26890 [compost metagenome]